jgi:hypothetical protein
MFYPKVCIMQPLKVAWYRVIALFTLYLFGLWYLLYRVKALHDPCQFYFVYTLNQVACFMQFVYKLFPPKWRNLTMKTLSYKLRRLSICSFDQITSLLFPPFQSFLFTMCWPCAFICWWYCNLLTSNQDLWLVRHKMYRDPSVQNRTCSIPKCVSCNF